MNYMLLLSILLFSSTLAIKSNIIPIIGLHGIFSNSTLLDDFGTFIENGTGRPFINLEYGLFEKLSSLSPIYQQTEHICLMLLFNKNVQGSKFVDLVGFSQGGLIMKALIQTCPFINVRYLVTVVTPNGGIYYPNNSINSEINFYSEYAQKYMSYAGYYRDPTKYDLYLKNSSFLAISNNEKTTASTSNNKKKMLNLLNHMTVYSTNDTVVSPYGSPMYDLYEYINGQVVYVPRNKTKEYINDVLGIRTLFESNRFHIVKTNCSHENHKEKECFPQLVAVIDFLNGKYDSKH